VEKVVLILLNFIKELLVCCIIEFTKGLPFMLKIRVENSIQDMFLSFRANSSISMRD